MGFGDGRLVSSYILDSFGGKNIKLNDNYEQTSEKAISSLGRMSRLVLFDSENHAMRRKIGMVFGVGFISSNDGKRKIDQGRSWMETICNEFSALGDTRAETSSSIP